MQIPQVHWLSQMGVHFDFEGSCDDCCNCFRQLLVSQCKRRLANCDNIGWLQRLGIENQVMTAAYCSYLFAFKEGQWAKCFAINQANNELKNCAFHNLWTLNCPGPKTALVGIRLTLRSNTLTQADWVVSHWLSAKLHNDEISAKVQTAYINYVISIAD